MAVASDVDQILARAVEAGVVPGVVALAAGDSGIVYEGAFGRRELSADAPMTADTVMWIASMTKTVTSVAVLQLVEQGRIELEAPLGDWIPELASLQVLEGFDDAGVPRLRPARKPVNLRQLLTHTAGFGYHLFNPDVVRYLDYTGIPDVGQCKNATLLTPLVCEPGQRFEYGINIDWVGKIVERLSGQSLEDYFREHIFGPLRMNDSGFLLRPAQRARLAGMHQRQPDGTLVAREFEMSQQPEFFMGGGGLYSTGADYLRFLRLLMGGGQLDGVRLLRSETVAAMGTNHIGALSLGRVPSAIPSDTNEFEFFPGLDKKWGLASMITVEEAPTGRSAGSLAWGGLANTYFWVDPHRHVTGLFMTQILPFADPDVLNLFEQFERGIYAGHAADT